MKTIACTFIGVTLFATFPVFAQTHTAPAHTWLRQTNTNGVAVSRLTHHGTNSVMASDNYPGITNVVTVSGTLIMEILSMIENPTTHKSILVTGTNGMSGGKQMSVYCLLAADGSSDTSFGTATAATSPVKVSDYLDQYVTITGRGRELQGKSGKVTQIMKITDITKTPAVPGSQPVVTASGILREETLTETENPTTHRSILVAGTNGISGGIQMTVYSLADANGKSVTSFGTGVADSSPVKVSDYLGQSVTIVGWGRKLQGKSGKELLQFRKITSITRSLPTNAP